MRSLHRAQAPRASTVHSARRRTTTSTSTTMPRAPSHAAAAATGPVAAAIAADAPQADATQGAADEDLGAMAERVRSLEDAAAAMHLRAQQLNKEGKFADAIQAYSEMHRLEDEASKLAQKVGCVTCVLGDRPSSSDDAGGPCGAAAFDPVEFEPYEAVYRLTAWPSGGPTSSSTAAAAVRARALGCVVGSAVADTAAMGVHWVYDLDLLAQLQRDREAEAGGLGAGTEAAATDSNGSNPAGEGPFAGPSGAGAAGLEFTDPPRAPFYRYKSGRASPYGEQTAVLRRSLAGAGGVECMAYAQDFAEAFGPGFDGYRDVSTKGFLRNFVELGLLPPRSGAADAQANCSARLAPLAAALAGRGNGASMELPAGAGAEGHAWRTSGDALRLVALVTRVTQGMDAAVAWASAGFAVLERLVMFGGGAASVGAKGAVQEVVAELRSEHLHDHPGSLRHASGPLASEVAAALQATLDLAHLPPSEAAAALGRNCHMPAALQTPLQVVLHVEHLAATGALPPVAADHGSSASGDTGNLGLYVLGVRLAIREGGCCASRAAYVGACLGALEGLDAVPTSWRSRCADFDGVLADAEAICRARDAA